MPAVLGSRAVSDKVAYEPFAAQLGELKGVIVAIDPATSQKSTIAFQYNPETLTRTLTPRQAAEPAQAGQRAIALRYSGVPKETIDLGLTFDAVDQLGTGRDSAAHIQLSEPLVRPRQAAAPQGRSGSRRRWPNATSGARVVPPEVCIVPKAGFIRPLLAQDGPYAL